MKIKRNNYIIGLGKQRIKGMKPAQIKFLDSNLKSVNEWISPGKYNSLKVNHSKESTLKRIGRAESTKMSEPEFSKAIEKL